MSMREQVMSGDAGIAVQVDGEAGKPWLVLSNSLAADMRMWDDQIPSLTRTHRVLRYDTRGHGKSSATPGKYSFDMLVGDVIAVLDKFGIEKTDVMGLSLGGMTALGLGLDHPGRVRSVVCCDARADAPPPFVQSWDERIASVTEKGTGALVDGTLARWFTDEGRKRKPEIAERATAMIRGTSAEGYIGCAYALKGLDYLRRLPQMKVPVLYVVGSEDAGAPKAAMQAMADATPGGRLVVLDGLAHVGNMEDPAAFDSAIAGWTAERAKAA